MTYAGLTISDKPALMEAKARGAEWVARDGCRDRLHCYESKPRRGRIIDDIWTNADGTDYWRLKDEDLQFIHWSDHEPVNIDLALAQIAEMEKNQVLSEIIDSIENPKPLTWNDRINQMTVEEKAVSERLTMPDYKTVHDDGSVTTQRFMIDGEKVRERAWDLYKRLKLYEDACFDDPNKDTSREVISIARLRELADAEKDGRVVVLPYKDGTDVIAVIERTNATGETRCKEGQNCFYCSDDCPHMERVRRFAGFEKRPIWMRFSVPYSTAMELANRIGKDVFLTEAEADEYITKATAERNAAALAEKR